MLEPTLSRLEPIDRRYLCGLHLSFGGGRRGGFHGHSSMSFLALETAFWFGVKSFPPHSEGNKVELEEVSLSVSAPWHQIQTFPEVLSHGNISILFETSIILPVTGKHSCFQ